MCIRSFISSLDFSEGLPSCMTFRRFLSNKGKQGLAGIIDITLQDETEVPIVFKISQHMNYITEHEDIVMKALEPLKEYCPHFVSGYGTARIKMDINYRKKEDPFTVTSKHPIDVTILFMEYLRDEEETTYSRFFDCIEDEDNPLDEKQVSSLIRQTMLASAVAQKKVGLCHYDLHSENILVKECEPDRVNVYVINGKKYSVPTHGVIPIIIDFGYSYCYAMENTSLFCPLAHTEVGFMSSNFDPLSDVKLFLVTVTDDIKSLRKNKYASKLRKHVLKMFKGMKLDLKSGWTDFDGVVSASDAILALVDHDSFGSKMFDKYSYMCVDIVQSLFTLPLKEESYEDIDVVYENMIKEFSNIEQNISNRYTNLYIFKEMITIIRSLSSDYETTRSEAVSEFKRKMQSTIDGLAKFCQLKRVNWEKLLCSTLLFANCAQGVCYEVVSKTNKRIQTEYDKLCIKTPLEAYAKIYKILETDIPDNPRMYIFDTDKETMREFNDDTVDDGDISDSDDGDLN